MTVNPSTSSHFTTSYIPPSTMASISNMPTSTLTVTHPPPTSLTTDTGSTEAYSFSVPSTTAPALSSSYLELFVTPTPNTTSIDPITRQLFTALFSLVMGLLSLAIALTAILILLLLARCAKRHHAVKPRSRSTKNGKRF